MFYCLGRGSWTTSWTTGPANLLKVGDSFWAPATQCLHHEWEKLHASSSTCWKTSSQLPVSTDIKGMTRDSGCSIQDQLLEWRDDRHIQCSRSALTPAGKQDICRTRTGVWNKAGGFSPGTKSGSLGSGENYITKWVMTGNAIPAATTSHLMVTMDVSHTATLRTWVGSPMEGHPQPVPKWAAELLVMEVKAEGNWRNDI